MIKNKKCTIYINKNKKVRHFFHCMIMHLNMQSIGYKRQHDKKATT